MKAEKILALAAAVMLLLAIPSIWPYGYFVILRWVVAGSAYIAYLAYEANRTAWIWTMAIVAILFNPIFPVHLTKEIWIVIDLAVAIIFLSFALIGKKRK